MIKALSPLLGALLLLLPAFCEARTCLMLYQLADNNLEYFIRQDYEELSVSPVISNDNLRTWIYYDALNQGGAALPNTVDENGSPVGHFTGARYITYNREWRTLQVDRTLGETNSDLISTVQNFLQHALQNCIADGYHSLMAVFSSHAGGFAGYGGDENKGRLLLPGGRGLLQSNRDIATAVRNALANTGGAPDRLEVIGFDACNMQAFEAADDYVGVANYLLGSEGLEPGHGWSYTFLNAANSALELSQQVVSEFLGQTQGGRYHQVPKTLAIVDLRKFETFLNSFENLSDDLLAALQGGDVSLHSFVSRARTSAVAFEGILDTQGARNPSSLDIGSFLQHLSDLCHPVGSLGAALEDARNSYSQMFVAAGVGPGTAPGTGMHIVWPTQGEYFANQALFNTILFQNSNYVTAMAPRFREFLSWFLNAAVPGDDGRLDNSVCGPQYTAQPPPSYNADPNTLIVTDTTTIDEAASTFHVETVIGPKVSQMLVEYSVDLSSALKPVLVDKGYQPQDDEYLLLKGGDVTGVYEGSTFESTWDQNFYFLNISGFSAFEALYVADSGNTKRVPVMFFPEESRSAVAELQFLDFLFFDFDYWQQQGGRYSYLMFSTDEAEGRINQNLALFISNGNNGFAEQPRDAGGLLMPLVYIDAYIQGRKLDALPGGFNQTIIEWKPELDYNILTTTSSRIFEVIPDADAITMNMYAWDHGDPDREPDARYYDVIRKTRTSEQPLFTNTPQWVSTSAPAETTTELGNGDDESIEDMSSAVVVSVDMTLSASILAIVGMLAMAF